MSPPIENESVTDKQEAGAAASRRTRAQAAMNAVPVAIKQEIRIMLPSIFHAYPIGTSNQPGALIAAPAVVQAAIAPQSRAGTKRRREADEAAAVADMEVDENGPPPPNPKGGYAKMTCEIDTNKFYCNFIERAAKVVKLEPSLTRVGRFNVDTFFSQGGGAFKMAATNGDFLGRFTNCFVKKTAPAADGASKKKTKVEEGA